MVIAKTSNDDDHDHELLLGAQAQTQDQQPPPPFTLVNDDNTVQLIPADPDYHYYPAPGVLGEPPPPEFAPYDAEFFQTSSGDIVSHDHHLNEDGEALYRFLLSQATTPPTYRLHCRGTHTESRTRWVSRRNVHGRMQNLSEHYIETVVDFDFYIDITQFIVPQQQKSPVHWSVADSDPAYRGLMVRQIDLPDGSRRKATRDETKVFTAWKKQRSAKGLPPWISSQSWLSGRNETLNSSRTLRQWADDYCSSPKHLKEFVYEKVIHGWNVENLKDAVRSTITSSLYQGNVRVDFELSAKKICVRPDNTLSRMLSNKWLKFISIILLIYPFIWLFKRYHSHGGGRWEVCGGAYALKHYQPLQQDQNYDTARSQGSSQGSGTAVSPRLVEVQNGTSQLIGLREGEWFRQWEGTIRRAVLNRYVSASPLYNPDGMVVEAALRLDGYSE